MTSRDAHEGEQGDQKVRYDCPVALTLDVIGAKWKPLILWELRQGPRRFNVLEGALPGITHKVLTQQLRSLERDGIIARVVGGERVRTSEYRLSDFGRTLHPVLDSLASWAKEHHEDMGVELDWDWERTM